MKLSKAASDDLFVITIRAYFLVVKVKAKICMHSNIVFLNPNEQNFHVYCWFLNLEIIFLIIIFLKAYV